MTTGRDGHVGEIEMTATLEQLQRERGAQVVHVAPVVTASDATVLEAKVLVRSILGDGRDLTIGWWRAGQAFLLRIDETTVLVTAADARRLADTIVGQLVELREAA